MANVFRNILYAILIITVEIGVMSRRRMVLFVVCFFCGMFQVNMTHLLITQRHLYIGISKLCLIIFALKSIYITHITQPLLSFEAVRPTSEDVQVEEIKGKLKRLVLSNIWQF